MPQPFLTIGIASYNYSKYLDKAFTQIKKQNFKDIEILYCDDGSTDGSLEKIQDMISREKNIQIRIVEGKHDGILANRNRIITHAAGKYLMICDADDYMLDGCLDKLCNTAKKWNADCVIGGFCEISDAGRILKEHIPDSHSSKWLYTWHHGQIYRTDILKKYQIRFEEIPDDVFYLQKIHKYSDNVVFVPETVYAWCRHGNSTSGDYIRNQEWHPVNLWKKIADNISELCSELTNKEDKVNLSYYLYKWYYFNIIDLWQEQDKEIKQDIHIMQEQMKIVNPGYMKFRNIKEAMGAGDTLFARGAVAACWVLEKVHLIYLVILIRKLQNYMRK